MRRRERRKEEICRNKFVVWVFFISASKVSLWERERQKDQGGGGGGGKREVCRNKLVDLFCLFFICIKGSDLDQSKINTHPPDITLGSTQCAVDLGDRIFPKSADWGWRLAFDGTECNNDDFCAESYTSERLGFCLFGELMLEYTDIGNSACSVCRCRSGAGPDQVSSSPD